MKKLILISLIILFSFSILSCGKKVIKNDINVTVFDNKNNPLKDVNLSLDGKIGKTDENGKFTFTQIEEGTYTLIASKDGFLDSSENILISEGKKQEIKITLKEKLASEEIKDFSDIDSFEMTIEYKTQDDSEEQKIEIIRENYGEKEYIKVIDLKIEKITTELLINGDKAKIRYEGEEWYELPKEQIGSISESFWSLAKDIVNSVREDYNYGVKTPEGEISYSVDKIGDENVNDYSTTKYIIKGKAIEMNNGEIQLEYQIWIINKGDYKNYPSRVIFNYNTEEDELIYKIDIYKYGEAKVPNL